MIHNSLIYFLHGDNQLLSRERLGEIICRAKNEEKEIIRLEGKITNLTEVKQALESQSLFGEEKLVVIENLFVRQRSKEKDEIVKYLKTDEILCDLVCWESKIIDGRSLRGFSKDWQILVFKTPAVIFKFLDSLKPKNTTQMLTLLRSSIKVDSPEMVFYMFASRIRQLIIAFDLGKEGLSGAPWQIGKLVSQAKKFSLERLIKLYRQLLEIDTNIKTGKTLMPLDWHLDVLLANL